MLFYYYVPLFLFKCSYFRAGTVTVTVIVQSHCTLERRLRRAKLDRKITLRFLTLGISYFRSLKPLTTQSTPKRPEFSSRFLTFGWILLSEDHPLNQPTLRCKSPLTGTHPPLPWLHFPPYKRYQRWSYSSTSTLRVYSDRV